MALPSDLILNDEIFRGITLDIGAYKSHNAMHVRQKCADQIITPLCHHAYRQWEIFSFDDWVDVSIPLAMMIKNTIDDQISINKHLRKFLLLGLSM